MTTQFGYLDGWLVSNPRRFINWRCDWWVNGGGGGGGGGLIKDTVAGGVEPRPNESTPILFM